MIRRMNKPGTRAYHHAPTNKKSLASFNIMPRLGRGGCNPNPRKLSDELVSTVVAMLNDPCTIIGGMVLTNISRVRFACLHCDCESNGDDDRDLEHVAQGKGADVDFSDTKSPY